MHHKKKSQCCTKTHTCQKGKQKPMRKTWGTSAYQDVKEKKVKATFFCYIFLESFCTIIIRRLVCVFRLFFKTASSICLTNGQTIFIWFDCYWYSVRHVCATVHGRKTKCGYAPSFPIMPFHLCLYALLIIIRRKARKVYPLVPNPVSYDVTWNNTEFI